MLSAGSFVTLFFILDRFNYELLGVCGLTSGAGRVDEIGAVKEEKRDYICLGRRNPLMHG
jgi:hypothetical protein